MAGKAKTLMVQGTGSHVGKSLLVAALCRIFAQDGWRVAPFKAQNMALNSYPTPAGGEIGRAQVVQAAAAGIAPTVDMNPILLKPETDSRSQVVVLGKPWRETGRPLTPQPPLPHAGGGGRGGEGLSSSLSARDYYRRKQELWAVVTGALERLRAQYDLVIIEGAGSPAEINLKASDIVNMAVARAAEAPVLLVGDIERGGIFASLLGTLLLLEEDERARVAGLIVNKFRGDPELFRDGVALLAGRTGKPVLGVVPYLPNLRIADEDSVSLEDRRAASGGDGLDVAVIRLPHLVNFDEFDALAAEPGVRLRYVERAQAFGTPAGVILPGTKTTVADLAWLRESGLAACLDQHAAAGRPLLGICGGYQMLGRVIRDPERVESTAGEVAGLGLLDLETTFVGEKATFQIRAVPAEGGEPLAAYEIHMGRTRVGPGLQSAFRVVERLGQSVDDSDGARHSDLPVVGTYLHGLFENAAWRRRWLAALGWSPAANSPELDREAEYDRLAATVRANLDMAFVRRLVEREALTPGPAPPGQLPPDRLH